ADGPYQTPAAARDAAGNGVTSPQVSVTVDNTAPTVTAKTPAAGATNVDADVNLTVTFSEAIEPTTISFVLKDAANNTVAGALSYDAATKTVTLNPNSDLNLNAGYTATLSGVKDVAGNPLGAPLTWSFTTTGIVTNATLFDETSVPAVAVTADTAAVEVGLQFRADIHGFVTGIRFYKGTGNTGTHVGHLWTAAGTLLATVTFTNESTSGWQQANFNTPVEIQANTTYVVSYYAPVGGYSSNVNFFTS